MAEVSDDVKCLIEQAYYYAEDFRLNSCNWDERFTGYVKRRIVSLLQESIKLMEAGDGEV